MAHINIHPLAKPVIIKDSAGIGITVAAKEVLDKTVAKLKARGNPVAFIRTPGQEYSHLDQLFMNLLVKADVEIIQLTPKGDSLRPEER